MKAHITDQDRTLIREAIERVEAQTSGEVFAVIARSSDTYLFIGLFWAALWALVAGIIIAFIAPYFWVTMTALQLVSTQTAAFLSVALLIILIKPLRLWLTPHHIQMLRAHRNANEQFLAHGLHTTDNRTGVLIFISLSERYAEIIPDTALNSHINDDHWAAIVDELTSGIKKGNLISALTNAIEQSGEHLKNHAPPGRAQNQIPNHLVEL